MLGNLRVVDDLIGGLLAHADGLHRYVADHALANSSVWFAVVASLMLIAAFR
jgi:hypothetical protein